MGTQAERAVFSIIHSVTQVAKLAPGRYMAVIEIRKESTKIGKIRFFTNCVLIIHLYLLQLRMVGLLMALKLIG